MVNGKYENKISVLYVNLKSVAGITFHATEKCTNLPCNAPVSLEFQAFAVVWLIYGKNAVFLKLLQMLSLLPCSTY